MLARVPDEVLAALERGATVVTPHERAARFVRSAWDRAQRSSGQQSWATPRVHRWSAWTALLWHDLLLRGATDVTLLNPVQEQYLWNSILERTAPEYPSAGRHALASQCMEAHRRLEESGAANRFYSQLASGNGQPSPGDDQLLAEAHRHLQARCRIARLLPAAQLDSSLTQAFRDGRYDPSTRLIVLFAFDQLAPARQAMLTAWRKAGGVATEAPALRNDGAAFVYQAEDHDAELRAMAQWAGAHLQAAPQAGLAVVGQDLRERRDEVEAALRETLAPETANVLAPSGAALYEFSLGRPLSSEPLIQSALDLLRWTTAPLPLPRISRLLLSAFLGRSGATRAVELEASALLDRKLRRQLRLRPQASLSETLKVLEDLSSTDPERFTGLLHTLRAMRHSELARDWQAASRPRRASAWITAFRSTLSVAAWATQLSSSSAQLRERWEGLLDQLSSLDLLGAEFPLSKMLDLLEQQARSTLVTPQFRDAPVQVLSPLEASGQTFDAAWVLGCGDLEWPPQRIPTPLLPLAAQAELGMLPSDARTERELAVQLTRALAASAPEVVFSYARHVADSAEQHLSSLVEDLGAALLHPDATSPVSAPVGPVPLERLTAEAAITPLPSSAVSGGARLLQLQSACGFRAFAELRLHSEEPETRLPGLDPRERGSAVHDALDLLWGRLESQQRLREMPSDQRNDLVRAAVDHGLRRAAAASSSSWDEQYLEIQRTRLHRLLQAWLDHERHRPAFTVRSHELKLNRVPVGPLHLSVRIDRIDQVNESHVLLDYKTRKTSASAWNGDRPEQPQMLVYAMLAAAGQLVTALQGQSASLDALAFANVIPGHEMSLSGVQRDGANLLPLSKHSSSDDLSRDLHAWTAIIERLATEFANGDVRVNPSNYPATCQHCGQHLLCRLDPELLAESAIGGEDVESEDE